MTVVDNDSNDADPADGSFLVVDVLADDYEVEETDGNGAAIDADPDRDVTVAAGADEVIGTQTTDDDTGANDAGPADGSFLVVDVLADDYEVEETDGNGAAIDADPDRDVTVAAGADEVIGT